MFLSSFRSGLTGPLLESALRGDISKYLDLLGAERLQFENEEGEDVQWQVQLQQALNHFLGFAPHEVPAA
jgi:hypothetical protein